MLCPRNLHRSRALTRPLSQLDNPVTLQAVMGRGVVSHSADLRVSLLHLAPHATRGSLLWCRFSSSSPSDPHSLLLPWLMSPDQSTSALSMQLRAVPWSSQSGPCFLFPILTLPVTSWYIMCMCAKVVGLGAGQRQEIRHSFGKLIVGNSIKR